MMDLWEQLSAVYAEHVSWVEQNQMMVMFVLFIGALIAIRKTFDRSEDK